MARPSDDPRPGGGSARSATADDFTYDALLEGLEGGRYGGRPLRGPGPVALVEMLRRLGWPADPRALAAAVPHFPEAFGLTEIRSTLHHLGYTTRRARASGLRLYEQASPALVLGRGDRLRVVAGGGAPSVLEARGRRAWTPRRWSRHDCVTAEAAASERTRPTAGVLATMAARFRPELRHVFLLTLLSGANLVAASLSIGLIFAMVLPAKALDTLVMLIVGIGGLLVFDLALRRIRADIVARVSARLEYILATEVHAKLVNLPVEMIMGAPVADQLGRLRQFETVRDLFSGPVVTVLLELPLVVLMLAVLAVVNWPCAAVALAGIALHALVGFVAVPRIREAQSTLMERQAKHGRLLDEVLAHREQIVRRGLGPIMADRLAPHHRRMAQARLEAEVARRRLAAALHVLTPLTGVGVLATGALQAMAGSMASGSLIVAMILAMRLLAPVHQALLLAVRGPELIALFRQLDALMNLAGGDRGPAAATPRPRFRSTAAGRLRMDGVVFQYPQSVTPALRGLTFEVPSGRLVAVRGASGAGKSTLLRAVVGAHPLRAGRVFLGQFNLAQIGSVRRTELVGHVGHHPLVIHGTVMQNLTLGIPEVDEDAVRAVCDEIGLLPVIEAMPQGFDARLIGGGSTALTPAFRTKLAIARLLLRSPSVLLLDEPDVRLSPSDEARLMDALRRRTERGATCLMVTHRPSLVRAADAVLSLEQGRVAALETDAGPERSPASHPAMPDIPPRGADRPGANPGARP